MMTSLNLWDQRFAQKEYVYGKQPNAYFREAIDHLTPGSILLPAEGEGRNAAYAAGRGWLVTAFDSSAFGRQKALLLAKEFNTEFEYLDCGYENYGYPEASFDAIALIYAHMPDVLRRNVHQKLIPCLKPGGTLILEAFSKAQLNYQSGGPKDISMLYSVEEIAEDFISLKTIELKEEIIRLGEGDGHRGAGAVIRFSGTRHF
jgi:SAM-dependent methyltransferase